MLKLSLARIVFAAALALAPAALMGCADESTAGESDGNDIVAAQAAGKFEIFQGADGKYYFHLLAGNYEKVLQSQGYASKSSATSGITSVKSNGADATKYHVLQSTDGQWYFNLVAGNGHTIGTSELYVSQSNAQRGADTVRGLVTSQIAAAAAAATGAKFEVFKGDDAKYYFHVRAANGEIVLQSQAYTSASSADNGTDSVRANGADVHQVEVLSASNGQAFFHVKAKNNRVVGTSEIYATLSNATRGRDAFVALMGGDTVEDP